MMGQLTPSGTTLPAAAAKTTVGVRNIGEVLSICEIALLSGMAQVTVISLPLPEPAT